MNSPTSMDDDDDRSAWQRFSDYVVRNIVPAVILPLGGGLIGLILMLNNTLRDITDIKTWQKDHQSYHTTRLQEVRERDGKVEQRFGGIDERTQRLADTISDLRYKVTTNEVNIQALKESNDKLESSLQDLKSDLRIAVEILNRLDRKQSTELKKGQ